MRHPDHTALEGTSVTLFWAHHEKMLLVDRRVGFMGGLDLCYGRYDLNYHPIADMHPEFPEAIVFNGQDYNNARVKDFHDIDKPEFDSIDRTMIPRSGWQDVAFQIVGPVCTSMERHFVERWEFLRVFKYLNRPKYIPMSIGVIEHRPPKQSKFQSVKNIGNKLQDMTLGHDDDEKTANYVTGADPAVGDKEEPKYNDPAYNPDARMKYNVNEDEQERHIYLPHPDSEESFRGDVKAQMVRSISDWSHGFLTEKSIQNAYISLIRDAKHSVYIENQFFIAGGQFSAKERFHNEIGDAITDRILQAARNNEKFRMIVVIPAIPGFPGDIKTDEAISIRAIMNFQYKSINRGDNSILERIAREGYNPADYIQFFHLRSYDRILPVEGFGAGPSPSAGNAPSRFQRTSTYMQQLVSDYINYEKVSIEKGARSTVSVCAFQNTPSLLEEGWPYPHINEAEHFVSEQLYIHSKLLIVDDQIVVCGSSNINDRSMLGDHDSEIAMVIEDPTPVQTYVDGQQVAVSQFATSLRRQLIRNHLGLVKPHSLLETAEGQEFTPDMQPLPTPNEYDFGSEEDNMVADPLSDDFWHYLVDVAKVNEEAYEDVFHVYPTDKVKNWVQYDEWNAEVSSQCHVTKKYLQDPMGVRQKLATIRGNLVPMAHDFLIEEKVLVQPGLQYNDLVSDVYA